MVKITDKPISPEIIINQIKTSDSGCVATYVGLIRDNSQGKSVLSVEYSDPNGTAEKNLQQIVNEARSRWQFNEMAIYHRIGTLKVGDINLVVAVAASHRGEGFAACQYTVDRFKKKLPTHKKETYIDDTHLEDG